VKPWGLLEVHDPEEFRRRYRHRLHQRGRRILDELRELELMYDGWPLLLCCFEDIGKPGAWCHRRVLAGWLSERLGVASPTSRRWSTPPASRRPTDCANSPPA
jgi:hypothetical protein